MTMWKIKDERKGKRSRKKGQAVCTVLMGAVFTMEVFCCSCGQQTETSAPTVQQILPEEPTQKASARENSVSGDSSVSTADAGEPEMVTITITAAGDVTMGNYIGQEYAYSFNQTYEEAATEGYFFENVYDLFSRDDMTIVNLEGVLTDSEEMAEGRTYNIKGDPAYAWLLTYGSIEAVSMGNNHRLDFGEQGTRDTLAALEPTGIVYAYDKNVGIYETKGVKIGFVSVNEVSWGQGVESLMKEGIARLQEENVDLILACCHWGIERDNYPTDFQQKFGRECIDWGADLVIGHHPHVLQGIEKYQGKYIIYSLANFCFGANRNPSDKDTMIARQTFTFIDGEKQEDTDFRIIPCSVSSVTTRNDYRPTPAEGEEKQRILNRINEYSDPFGLTFDEEGRSYDNFN